MRSVELFAGAGGLALGVSYAGFKHQAVIEWDKNACETVIRNKKNGLKEVVNWPIHEIDVNKFDFSTIKSDVELLAGGPPCQPFSIGGQHRGFSDERNMFPAFVRTVKELRPKAILIENVKGLLRSSFSEYFEYIILQVSYPEIERKPSELWTEHLARLEQHHTSGHTDGLSYRVVFRLLNAADYGVPQRRERVFIVGFRSDLNIDWSFPEPTHSSEYLIWGKWGTGEYWERHGIHQKDREPMPVHFNKVEKLQVSLFNFDMKPWRTVRDVLSDLPDPEKNPDESAKIPNHVFMPGAKVYPGHTGSPLDEPAKTLKAGVHGVPGGENMIAFPDGRVRYFTVREAARLQTFPDNYFFPCSWTESMRQIGNAVPVVLGEKVATHILEKL